MSENPVKEGFLLYGGIEKSMQSSQKKYCKLFRGSTVGVDRLEVLLEKDDDDGEIISLEGCLKIAKIQAHQPYTFVVVTKSEKTYLSADSTKEMNDWLSALQSVAFRFEKEKKETVPSMTESLTVIKNNNQLKNLMKKVKHLENDLKLQQADSKVLRRKVLRLERKIAVIKLGEVATLLITLFRNDNRRYQRFLQVNGFTEEDCKKYVYGPKDARGRLCHSYGYRPKTIRIPDQATLEKLVRSCNFKAENKIMYQNL